MVLCSRPIYPDSRAEQLCQIGGRWRGAAAGCEVRSGQQGSVLPTAGKLECSENKLLSAIWPPGGVHCMRLTSPPLCQSRVGRRETCQSVPTTDWTDKDFAKNYHRFFDHAWKTRRDHPICRMAPSSFV